MRWWWWWQLEQWAWTELASQKRFTGWIALLAVSLDTEGGAKRGAAF